MSPAARDRFNPTNPWARTVIHHSLKFGMSAFRAAMDLRSLYKALGFFGSVADEDASRGRKTQAGRHRRLSRQQPAPDLPLPRPPSSHDLPVRSPDPTLPCRFLNLAGTKRGDSPRRRAAGIPCFSLTLQSDPRHMTLSSASRTGLLTLVLLGAPAVTHGQTRTQATPPCDTYDSCALRIQHHVFSTRIVRGEEDMEVAQIRFRTPALQELFARSDRAAISFDDFRQDHTRSAWLGLLGGIGFVGGLVAGAYESEEWAAGLSIGGTVFSVSAGVFRTKSLEHLSKAIWCYNQSLSEQGGR